MAEVAPLGSRTYLSLGWRNLWCHPSRTLLILSSVLMGVGALTFMGAMHDGWANDLRQNFVLTLQGHVQVHAQGFATSEQIQHHIVEPDVIIRMLEGRQDVATWALRIRAAGLAAVAAASIGVEILGIDSAREASLTRLPQFVTRGTWLQEGDSHGVLLGRQLAEHLGVELGDKIILMAQTPSGTLTSELFRLRGILHAGVFEVDQQLALISLDSAQRMFELGRGVTDVVIRATSESAVDALSTHLQAALPQTDYEVFRWWDRNPGLVQHLALVSAFAHFILLIVALVVIAEILNTMLMVFYERTRELGLMEALGTRKVQLCAMLLWESGVLVMSGGVAGYLLGALAVLHFGRTGIDLSRFAQAFTFVYTNPVMHPVLTWPTAVKIIGTTFVAALLAGLYPAWKATRLHPAEALRHI